jgi:predicted nucleotidyltransferase
MSEPSRQAVEPEDRLGMTDEQWERFQAYTHGFGEQDENGVDVSLLRENLRLTPEQRVLKLLPALGLYQRQFMAEPMPDFAALLGALHAHHVHFVLIGGLAMIAQGSDAITRDVDIYYARDPGNLEALARALAPLHPRLRGADQNLPFRWDARTLRSGLNFTLITDAGAIDLLGEAAGAEAFEPLWSRSSEMEFFGVPVRVASVEHLIDMKRAAGRPKDQVHLLELERLRALLSEAAQPKPEGE